MTTRLETVYARIDQANADDPHTIDIDGMVRPYAVFYGERMSAWLRQLVPDAGDPLAIAVRAQHIRRFDIPRSS
jgi:hypothetical protein